MTTLDESVAETMVLASIATENLAGVMMGIDLQIAEPGIAAEVMRQAEQIVGDDTLRLYRGMRDEWRGLVAVMRAKEQA
jgi:hypothetical protein